MLLLVKLSDQIEDLLEAVVHELICFFNELIVSNEDGVVSINEGHTVGQLLLCLRGQEANNTFIDANLEHVMLVFVPVVHLDQLNEAFCHLEEVIIRIGWDHHHEAK